MRGRVTDQTGIEWPTCDEDGCIGVRLAATPKCLAHARDEQRNTALKQLGETAEIDARGVPITQALLKRILAAAPHDAEDHPTFTAHFELATFQGPAEFVWVTFQRHVWFLGAAFRRSAGFNRATFQDGAAFVEATFQTNAWFREAAFQRHAGFDGATFQDAVRFDGATIRGHADFGEARFEQALKLGPLLVYGVLRLDAA